jgi:hypothetical protein
MFSSVDVFHSVENASVLISNEFQEMCGDGNTLHHFGSSV